MRIMTKFSLLLLPCSLLLSTTSSASRAATELPVECSLAGYSLISVRSGVNLDMERAGKAVVAAGKDGFELGFLTMPGCKVETILPGVAGFPAASPSVTVGGDVLFDSGHVGPRTLYFKASGQAVVALQKPSDVRETPGLPMLSDSFWNPVLSDDGRAVVWSVTESRGGGETNQHLQARSLVDGSEKSIPLESVHMGYELLSANVTTDEFALAGYPNRALVVDHGGNLKWGPKTADAIQSVDECFRRVGDGWVAWDLVRTDSAAVRLQWSLAAGSGQREYPLSSLESVSVDPSGLRIAVSTSASSTLNDEESISIVRVSDGKDLYRRTLPRWSRAHLAFLGSEYLAVSTSTGVDVVRVPGASDEGAFAEVEPAKPIDVQARVLDDVSRRAEMFGLKLEKPSPDTAAKLVGRWQLADVGKLPCGGGMPFLEFKEDGYAYEVGSRTRGRPYAVTDQFIRVGEAEESMTIFQLSGGFYLPSHECVLIKLERMP